MTYDEIKEICEKYNIENWTLNPETGLVDVNDVVELHFKRDLTELPLNFGNVNGGFWCFSNSLTTLKGAPKIVDGVFNCVNNNLMSLDYSPHYVGGNFICTNNKLTSLKGLPKIISGDFRCYRNLSLPLWEYRWLFYVEIGGKIEIDMRSDYNNLQDFLNKHKNPPKSNIPKLFTELKTLGND